MSNALPELAIPNVIDSASRLIVLQADASAPHSQCLKTTIIRYKHTV